MRYHSQTQLAKAFAPAAALLEKLNIRLDDGICDGIFTVRKGGVPLTCDGGTSIGIKPL